jgi:FAD/FMN-containing dehydrogenase/Fe-S oxidoreductase
MNIEAEVNKTTTIPATNGKSNGSNGRLATQFTTQYSKDVDAKALEVELKDAIEGEVRFDNGSRALYATDASNYRQIPIGVVLPKNENDILQTINICRKYKAPLLSRGGGTSLAGQCCNVAVIMDMSKYFNQILYIDKEKKLVSVQPGIVLDEVRTVTQNQADLTFGPDPATHSHCTIGGMLGNNSCGVHSVMAANEGGGARTSDNVESLTIITYDGLQMQVGKTSDEALQQIINEGGREGEIYKKLKDLRVKYADLIRERFPKIPRRVSGYNLDELLPEKGFNVARALVGTESTCVTVVEATLQLLKAPKTKTLVALGYDSLPNAGRAVMEILKYKPIGLEGIDHLLIEFSKRMGLLTSEELKLLPKANAWLLAEFGGDTKKETDAAANAMIADLKTTEHPPSYKVFDDEKEEQELWKIRESGLGATAWVPGEKPAWPGWEDSAVDPKYIGDYLEDLEKLFKKYGYHPSVYGHFGQGIAHCSINFDLFTHEGINAYKKFTVEASYLVKKYNGSLSGEHGDGQSRGDLLEIMYGKELVQAFREFKAIWDPEWKMNPGKIVNTYGQLKDLRVSDQYNPKEPKTHFKYPADAYSFNRVTLRCAGVGECRNHNKGTMCPSYMVTREEKHSTRGRARMLFEMMQHEELKKGWRNKDVKESLDLCLSCKGCKGDCPVQVDMATYKSEFLSHYYEGRLRPASAYAFGWIYWWSRLASKAPFIANFFFHAPVISNIVKAIAGVDQKRKMPKYAEITFREWFAKRQSAKNRDKRQSNSNAEFPNSQFQNPKSQVILWPDTFNNYFLPETLVAGVEVLEAAGFEVIVPERSMCCGRPLYDFGMLNTAKGMLLDIMHNLQQEIRHDIPIVGLEPSCVSVFKDELLNLFPDDYDAKRLNKNVFTLAEFLEKKAPGFEIPKVNQKAVVHGHCHHKAIMKFTADNNIIKKTGLDAQVLDSGCCGLAGGFGYEKGEHYNVSIKAGERVLLPAVRKAAETTIIMADGFSCREQIEQETDRKALHLAQVLQMGLRDRNPSVYLPLPEKKYVDDMKLKYPSKKKKTLLFAGIVGVAIAMLYVINKKNK